MNKLKAASDNKLLSRIANHLIMNASQINDLGLYHGKMGIVLFFAHYARYTGKSIYERIAADILDDLYEKINTGLLINFEAGLCGICWGIEYLLQNEFMKGDSDDILGDIDQIIMERDLRRIQDESIETGLAGISCYIYLRLNSPIRTKKEKPFDEVYLTEWYRRINVSVMPDCKQILRIILGDFSPETSISKWKPGLNGGCAGYGLNQILR